MYFYRKLTLGISIFAVSLVCFRCAAMDLKLDARHKVLSARCHPELRSLTISRGGANNQKREFEIRAFSKSKDALASIRRWRRLQILVMVFAARAMFLILAPFAGVLWLVSLLAASLPTWISWCTFGAMGSRMAAILTHISQICGLFVLACITGVICPPFAVTGFLSGSLVLAVLTAGSVIEMKTESYVEHAKRIGSLVDDPRVRELENIINLVVTRISRKNRTINPKEEDLPGQLSEAQPSDQALEQSSEKNRINMDSSVDGGASDSVVKLLHSLEATRLMTAEEARSVFQDLVGQSKFVFGPLLVDWFKTLGTHFPEMQAWFQHRLDELLSNGTFDAAINRVLDTLRQTILETLSASSETLVKLKPMLDELAARAAQAAEDKKGSSNGPPKRRRLSSRSSPSDRSKGMEFGAGVGVGAILAKYAAPALGKLAGRHDRGEDLG